MQQSWPLGSRDGHTAIFLWYAINQKGYRAFQKEVQYCLRNAYYHMKECLREANIGVLLNEFSRTVVFERPLDETFILKWQLPCQGKIAHVVVMPSVTVEKRDDFGTELFETRKRAFPYGSVFTPSIVEDVCPENSACSAHQDIKNLKSPKEERKHFTSSKGIPEGICLKCSLLPT